MNNAFIEYPTFDQANREGGDLSGLFLDHGFFEGMVGWQVTAHRDHDTGALTFAPLFHVRRNPYARGLAEKVACTLAGLGHRAVIDVKTYMI